MNFAELIYKLNEFYFTDLWHFCGLLLLILTIRGDVSRGLNSVNRFFHDVKVRYKARINKTKLAEEVRKNIPTELKKFAKLNTEKEA